MKKQFIFAVAIASLAIPAISIAEIKAIYLHVDGFYCDFCSNPTLRRVKNLDNVQSVDLWLADGIVKVVPKKNASFSPDEYKAIFEKSSYVYRSMSLEVEGNLKTEGESIVLDDPDNNVKFYLEPSETISLNNYKALQKAANTGGKAIVTGNYNQEENRHVLLVDKVVYE